MRSARNLTGGDAVLTAEFLLCLGVVAVRVVGDYEINDNGAQKGTLNTPANGGWGPLTVLTGLLGSFFLLGFLASGGGGRAKIANLAGGLLTVVLIIKSDTEISTVAGYVSADPSTRTVTAATWNTGGSQSWGQAANIGGSGSGSQLTAFTSSSGTPFNTGALPDVLSISSGGSTPAAGTGTAGTTATTANTSGLATLPYGTALTGSSATAWATAILQGLGAPASAANVQSLVDWFGQEGGGGVNNPLNTTTASGGTAGETGTINSVGVASYDSPAAGVAATVKSLEQPLYTGIVSALKSGSGLVGNSSVGSELSAWSGGGYSSV
jgi:hypothetical protein